MWVPQSSRQLFRLPELSGSIREIRFCLAVLLLGDCKCLLRQVKFALGNHLSGTQFLLPPEVRGRIAHICVREADSRLRCVMSGYQFAGVNLCQYRTFLYSVTNSDQEMRNNSGHRGADAYLRANHGFDYACGFYDGTDVAAHDLDRLRVLPGAALFGEHTRQSESADSNHRDHGANQHELLHCHSCTATPLRGCLPTVLDK